MQVIFWMKISVRVRYSYTRLGFLLNVWFSFRLPYPTIFGGAGSFTKHDFQLINGFSNQFWGWGGEDDDLYKR